MLQYGINLFLGENAQGKTNLLEAAYYILRRSSFRTVTPVEIVKNGENRCFIKGDILRNGISYQVEAGINLEKKERFWRFNNQASSPNPKFYLPVIVFTPEDLFLIKGYPSNRRRFIDEIAVAIQPSYSSIYKNYMRCLKQRNQILKNLSSCSRYNLYLQLEPWEKELSYLATEICLLREKICSTVNVSAGKLHRMLSGKEEVLTLVYQTEVEINSDKKQIQEEWEKLFKLRRSQEIHRKITLSGPQRDDIEIMINGLPARYYASQGQQRTAALSLKLAHKKIIEQMLVETPVLLLDDIFSELDQSRSSFLVNQLLKGKNQSFITSTNTLNLPELHPAVYKVNAGKVVFLGRN